MWIEKYKPRTFDGIIGNAAVIKYIKEYKWKRPLLIYGSTGVGKTVLAEAIANEFNFELVEITNRNISDAKTIAQTGSIFGKRKLILIDGVDMIRKIREVTDFLKSMKVTKNPTLLITSNFKSKRLSTIKRLCEKLQVRRAYPGTIAHLLGSICKNEGISADKEILVRLAENAGGDIRSAINDLEMVGMGKSRLNLKDLDILKPRDRSTDIYNALNLILIKRDMQEAIRSTWDLDQQPRDTLMWIDENLPRVYTDREEIGKSYYYLSRADVFIGRILRRQYWGFLRYANPLMTGGVNISKGDNIHSTRYQFPMYISRMGQTKKERSLKKSIGEKLSGELHVSKRIVADEYIPLFRVLLKNKKLTGEELAERFKLDSGELEYIIH